MTTSGLLEPLLFLSHGRPAPLPVSLTRSVLSPQPVHDPRPTRNGADDDIHPDLDWTEDAFSPQDLDAIYSQVAWEPAMGGGTRTGAGGAGAGGGIHSFVHHLAPSDMTANDPWMRGAAQEQLSAWGVQAPPGLARQYATTRHGDRGTGGLVSGSHGLVVGRVRGMRHVQAPLAFFLLFLFHVPRHGLIQLR